MVLEDTEGQIVDLSGYRGRHAVLLFFMRSTTCPACNRHVRTLVEDGPELAARGVRVLIAVPEDRAAAAAWRARRQIPFPVLTGRGASPHEAIGLSAKLFGSIQQSGSILIDRRGVVRHAHSATNPLRSFDKTGIAAAVAALPDF
jgi:peroxiredoxin